MRPGVRVPSHEGGGGMGAGELAGELKTPEDYGTAVSAHPTPLSEPLPKRSP